MSSRLGTSSRESFSVPPPDADRPYEAAALVSEAAAPLSRRMFSLGLSCGVTSLLLLGCSSQKTVHLGAPRRKFEPEDYKSALRDWTRSRRLNTLEEMDNVLTVTSTYYSAEFRAAYLAKYRADFHLTEQEARGMAAEHRAINASEHEFYVALYAQTHKYGLLDAEESAWQVHLINSHGHVEKPDRVERIARPGVMEETYFPYTSSFRNVFRVTFKKAADFDEEFGGAKWFGLRFSGPQGTSILTWNVAST